MLAWLIDWLIGDWKIGLLCPASAGCSPAYSPDCFIDSLNDWFIDWLHDWFIDWLNDWYIDWLNDWFFDWLNNWYID